MGINSQHLLQYVIRPTLLFLGLDSPSAENLLLGTCAQESQMGTYLKQINGPALGIYQIEPATHTDVWNNYIKARPKLSNKLWTLWNGDVNELITNLSYATAIARLIYLRVPEPLPNANDLDGLARYYKIYYNSQQGAANEIDFINNYQKYIG